MDEFQKKLINEIKDYKYGVVLIFIGLMFIGLCLLCSSASAESAIVSFDDAEHLVALTDSVVGVCDTTWEGWQPCFPSDTALMKHPDGSWTAFKADGSTIHYNQPPDSCYMYYQSPIITCRELVCVTAKWPEVVVDTVSRSYDGFFDDIFPTKTIPGIAIIDYRRVKQ